MRRTLSDEQSGIIGGGDADDAPEAPELNIPQSKTGDWRRAAATKLL